MMTSETRSPEEIEREIERERAGLTNTLEDLQDKFSVDTIVRQISDQFRDNSGEITRSVSDAVKRNPVALALTGVGLAWLMLGDKTDRRDPYENRDRGEDSDDFYTRDRFARTRSRRRPAVRSQGSRAHSLGPERGDPSEAFYYKGDEQQRDLPSWVGDGDQHSESKGMGAKLGGAAQNAGESLSGAASTAGTAVADTAKSVGGSISDAGRSVSDSAQHVATAASERAMSFRDRLSQGTEHLSEEARQRVIAARERALEARDAVVDYGHKGSEKMTDLFEDYPLVTGALAVAVGAAIGAALPRTRIEDDYLGQHSEHLVEEAERIFAEESEKLSKVAHAATDEAKRVLHEFKEDAQEATDAVVKEAGAAGERVADAARTEADKQNLGNVTKP